MSFDIFFQPCRFSDKLIENVNPFTGEVQSVPCNAPLNADELEAVQKVLREVTVRGPDEVIYHQELDRLAGSVEGIEVRYTFTRTPPAGWTGYQRRIDAAMLEEVGWPPASGPSTFVCGPTQFVETAANVLVASAYPAARIKTERFGPTGGA